jgi:hypothetical protein
MSQDLYEEAVGELGRTHPQVAAALLRAHSNRMANLRSYRNGARLRGLEELLTHLEMLATAIDEVATAPPIAFLFRRVRADFETALEATLTAYPSVAHDAMRDVMEVEFLIREFGSDPPKLRQWLEATPQELKQFRPVELRKRHADRLGKRPQDMPEATDYAGHSMVLHVNPRELPIAQKGMVGPGAGFSVDMCFWEMFQHARRLVVVAHALLKTPEFVGVRNPEPTTQLPAIADAWVRTQQMQEVFFAILKSRRTPENEDLEADRSLDDDSA